MKSEGATRIASGGALRWLALLVNAGLFLFIAYLVADDPPSRAQDIALAATFFGTLGLNIAALLRLGDSPSLLCLYLRRKKLEQQAEIDRLLQKP